MAITRSNENRLALQLDFLAAASGVERRREFGWLLAASLLVAAGLSLVVLARTQELAAARQQLQTGQLVNLNEAGTASRLTPLLGSVLPDGPENVIQQRIEAFLNKKRPLANVGALAYIRLQKQEIEQDVRWQAWRQRLAGASKKSSSIALLPMGKLKPSLVVRTPNEYLSACAIWLLAYLAGFWAVHRLWRLRGFRGDGAILPAIHMLTGMGLILMVSLRDPLRDTLEFRKFVWGVLAGCAILLLPLFKAFQYRRFERWIYTPLFAALALFLGLLSFGSGPTGSDARVNLGPMQPVELIKLLLVFFLAGYFARNWERLRELRERRFVPSWLAWLELPRVDHALPVMSAVACALVLFFTLKDMGPALVIGMLFLLIFATARGRAGLALLGLLLLVGGVFAGYDFGTPHTVVERVSMWLSPWDNAVHGGDQLAQSLWAFATGGPWGSGLGWGDPSVIPAGHTDLVLPALAEEWGFPGVAAIGLLFGLLVVRCFRAALRAPDEYGMFLAAGCGISIALEMLLISGGALGVIPLSGVASPFLSSGNTSMLASFLVFAIILGISNHSAREEVAVAGQHNEFRFSSIFGKPLRVVAASLAICTLALLAKAAYIEIFQDQQLLSKDALVYASDGVKRPEHNPRLNLLAASIPRGDIYDRNGLLLATSKWSEVESRRRESAELGVPASEAGLPSESRHYPFGAATVHLLGDWRTGERFHASNASFVEHDSNRKLQGYSDYAELAKVVRYRHQQENPSLQALLQRNRDVRTTLDVRLQLRVIEILEKHLRRGAKKGAVLMLNAQSGDVLALVSWPLPASPGAPGDAMLDRARYGQYPPGSTFKLVTAAASLRADPANQQRIFACRRLSDGRAGVIIPGWRRPVRDDIGDRVHGRLAMEQAIAVSCNAYFAQLGVYAVGAKALRQTAGLFGINAGSERQVKEMLPFAAYGQGAVVATPMQMARVAATIAEQGNLPQGRWVLDGSDERSAVSSSVMPASQAEFLASAMRQVVTSGTARRAMAGLDIPLAGKTGTAQLDRGEPHSWFVGFAPYGAPLQNRIAFAVIVEHGGYGATVAGPIARDLVEAAASLGIIRGSD